MIFNLVIALALMGSLRAKDSELKVPNMNVLPTAVASMDLEFEGVNGRVVGGSPTVEGRYPCFVLTLT